MKKILIFAGAIFLLSAALGNVSAQVGDEAGMSGKFLGNIGNYRMDPLGPDPGLNPHQDFLDQLNGDRDILENSPINKMSVGVINTTTAWTEIPRRITVLSEEANPLVGMTVGFAEGLASGIQQGAAGVVDLTTFSLPPYDEPLMQPKYKAKDPNRGFQVDLLQW